MGGDEVRESGTSSISVRWHAVTERGRSAGERFPAAAELVCLPLGFLTFAGLLAEALLRAFGVELFSHGSVGGGLPECGRACRMGGPDGRTEPIRAKPERRTT